MGTCWPTIESILLTAPGVAVAYITIYFFYLKFGNKVSCSFSVTHSMLTEEQIDNLLLKNHKGKTLSIFSIDAVLNNEVVLEVEKFKAPIILKALESIVVKTTPVSFYSIGNDRFEPDYFPEKKIDIYLTTDLGIIKCKQTNHPDSEKYEELKHLTRANKRKKSFNDIVYNDSAKYALVFSYEDTTNTAFILPNGYIYNSEFNFNQIPVEQLETVEILTKYFKSLGFKDFLVHELK